MRHARFPFGLPVPFSRFHAAGVMLIKFSPFASAILPPGQQHAYHTVGLPQPPADCSTTNNGLTLQGSPAAHRLSP